MSRKKDIAAEQRPLTPEAVADLYESAIDPTAWSGFATTVGRAVGVEGAAVVLMNGTDVTDVTVTEAIRADAADYQTYYQHLDPWRVIATRTLPDQVVLSSEIVPERDFLASEFYNDYARRFGMFRPMNVYFGIGGTMAAAIGVEEPFTRRPFEAGDKPVLERLAPFIKRALQLRVRIGHQHLPGRLSLAGLDTLAIGMVICDASANIVYANRAAEDLAARSGALALGRRGGGLQATRPDEARRFSAAICDAAGGGTGAAMNLVGRSGRLPLVALVCALPRSLAGDGVVGYALVALRALSDDAAFSETMLV